MPAPNLPASLSFKLLDRYDLGHSVPVATVISLDNPDPIVTGLPEIKYYERVVEADGSGGHQITLPFTAISAVPVMVGKEGISITYTLPETANEAEAFDPVTWEKVEGKLAGTTFIVDDRPDKEPILLIRYRTGVTTIDTKERLVEGAPTFGLNTVAGTNVLSLNSISTTFEPVIGETINVAVDSTEHVRIKVFTPNKFQKHVVALRDGPLVLKDYLLDVRWSSFYDQLSKVVIDERPVILKNGLLKLDSHDCELTLEEVPVWHSSIVDMLSDGYGFVLKVNGNVVDDITCDTVSDAWGYVRIKNLNVNSSDTLTISYTRAINKWMVLPENVNPLYINRSDADGQELTRNLSNGDLELFLRESGVWYRYTHHNKQLHKGINWDTKVWPKQQDLHLATVHLNKPIPEIVDIRQESQGVILPTDKETIDWRSHSGYGFYAGEAIPSNVIMIQLTSDVVATINATATSWDEYKVFFKTFLNSIIAIGSYVIVLDDLQNVLYWHEQIFDNET